MKCLILLFLFCVQLLDGEQFALRKGAGYGLAGLVKGLGIGSLKQMNIMPTLTEAVQNKKNYRHREGQFPRSWVPLLPTGPQVPLLPIGHSVPHRGFVCLLNFLKFMVTSLWACVRACV